MTNILILLLVPLLTPLGVQWDSTHSSIQKIKNYKHLTGSVEQGEVTYLGKDLKGLETELQLSYSKRKLVSALLILGPAGIDDINCLKKYKSTVTALNDKYGQFKYRRVVKDPIIEDLLVVEFCNSARLGLYEVETRWETHRFRIVAEFVGDHSGLYIHITYRDKDREGIYKKQKRKNILQRL